MDKIHIAKIERIARKIIAKDNDIKNDYMICGYRPDNNGFKITCVIENRCFMQNYGYDEIKKSVKEVNSILKKIERIANRLGCKKIGFKQNGTMNAVWYKADTQDNAQDMIETASKIKPNFIVNKLK